MVSKVLESEMLLVFLFHNSNPVDMLILPDVASNNQPIPQPAIGANNFKLCLNRAILGLENDPVCEKGASINCANGVG